MIRNPLGFVGSLKVAGWDFDFENLRIQNDLMEGMLSEFAGRIEYICMHGNVSDFIDRAAFLWNILHFVIYEYQSTYPSWLFIKHEDIALKPELEFLKIFNYLGIDMNRNIRMYIEEYASPRNPHDATTTSYRPRNLQLVIETWKDRLSKDEIERVKSSTKEIALLFYGDMV